MVRKRDKPQVLVDGLVFPESPRWYGGALWFSDVKAFTVLRVTPPNPPEVVARIPGHPSGLGFLPDRRLLIVSMSDLRVYRLEPSGELTILADVSELVRGTINDMVVDAAGRGYVSATGFDFFAGEQAQPGTSPGSVFLVEPTGAARIVADRLNFPNGSTLLSDRKTYVVAESTERRLTAFDVQEDGSLVKRRPFAELEGDNLGRGSPDGICADADGAVWVSCPYNSEFVRVARGGAVLDRVAVPGRMAVACALGGQEGRTLFMCTSVWDTVEDIIAGRTKGWIESVQVEVPAPSSRLPG